MDLPQSQMGMLEMQFFRTPSIRDMIQNKFNDFHRRARNHWHLCLIQDDVFIASFAQQWSNFLSLTRECIAQLTPTLASIILRSFDMPVKEVNRKRKGRHQKVTYFLALPEAAKERKYWDTALWALSPFTEDFRSYSIHAAGFSQTLSEFVNRH